MTPMETLQPDVATAIGEQIRGHLHYQLNVGDDLNAAQESTPANEYKALVSSIAATCNVSVVALKQWRWVAAAIPADLRLPTLSYGHFRAAAPKPAELRQRLLQQAARNKESPAAFERRCQQYEDPLAFRRRQQTRIRTFLAMTATGWVDGAESFLQAVQEAANAAVKRLG